MNRSVQVESCEHAIHRNLSLFASCVATLLLESVRLGEENAMANNRWPLQFALFGLCRGGNGYSCAWIYRYDVLSRLERIDCDCLWWFGDDDIGSVIGHSGGHRIVEETIDSNRFLRENLQSRHHTGLSIEHWLALRCKLSRNILEIDCLARSIHFRANIFHYGHDGCRRWSAFLSILARLCDAIFHLFAAIPSNGHVRSTVAISFRSNQRIHPQHFHHRRTAHDESRSDENDGKYFENDSG